MDLGEAPDGQKALPEDLDVNLGPPEKIKMTSKPEKSNLNFLLLFEPPTSTNGGANRASALEFYLSCNLNILTPANFLLVMKVI